MSVLHAGYYRCRASGMHVWQLDGVSDSCKGHPHFLVTHLRPITWPFNITTVSCSPSARQWAARKCVMSPKCHVRTGYTVERAARRQATATEASRAGSRYETLSHFVTANGWDRFDLDDQGVAWPGNLKMSSPLASHVGYAMGGNCVSQST